MTDYSELKRLAEAFPADLDWDSNTEPFFNGPSGESLGGGATGFYCVYGKPFRLEGEDYDYDGPTYVEACPADFAKFMVAARAGVLTLIAENERYRKYGCDTCDGSGHLHRADGEYFGECTSCGAYELEQAKRERDELKAENAGLKTGYEAYEQVNAELKAEVEALRATVDLQKLLPEISDALEELELHGLHSDQGYRKLRDWYRKVGLAYRVIQGPMFGAEHGELVSQNTWLRSVVEHYAQQHAPLEPIPDSDGWSTRLPGYDLPTLLRDAERYRWLRDQHWNEADMAVVSHPKKSVKLGFDCPSGERLDESVDAAMGKGEQA